LGRLPPCPDLDLIVPGDAIPVARDLARRFGGSCVVLDRERSIARLVLRGWTIDLARCMGRDLDGDLARRDFTVNAMALPLSAAMAADSPGPDLIDPLGGLTDLRQRRVVAVAERNLLDDPLRLLRGVRLATELEFGIDPLTRGWIETHHGRIGTVAGERVLAELIRLAEAPEGQRGLGLAIDTGLLRPWAGAAAEAPHMMELLARLDERQAARLGLGAAEREWALRLARLAVVLDETALRRLHGSRELTRHCRLLRHWLEHLQAGTEATDPSVASGLDRLPEQERFDLQRSLEPILPALLLCQPMSPDLPAAMERWRDPGDPLFHPRSPLDGDTLQRCLALPPGPTIGRLIDHLARERAFSRLPPPAAGPHADRGEAEEATAMALAAARSWLEEKTMRHD
jgi:tRNA nucleotidyltransferase (CCA-adding enzyme)